MAPGTLVIANVPSTCGLSSASNFGRISDQDSGAIDEPKYSLERPEIEDAARKPAIRFVECDLKGMDLIASPALCHYHCSSLSGLGSHMAFQSSNWCHPFQSTSRFLFITGCISLPTVSLARDETDSSRHTQLNHRNCKRPLWQQPPSRLAPAKVVADPPIRISTSTPAIMPMSPRRRRCSPSQCTDRCFRWGCRSTPQQHAARREVDVRPHHVDGTLIGFRKRCRRSGGRTLHQSSWPVMVKAMFSIEWVFGRATSVHWPMIGSIRCAPIVFDVGAGRTGCFLCHRRIWSGGTPIPPRQIAVKHVMEFGNGAFGVIPTYERDGNLA